MKKIAVSLLLLLCSNAAFSKTADAYLVTDNRQTMYFQIGEKKIYLAFQNAQFNQGIEKGVFVIKFLRTNQVFPLAHVNAEKSNSSYAVSKETVKINVLIDRIDKKFKSKVCSHAGCFFYPHIDKTPRTLIEIETLDNQILCFHRNVLDIDSPWILGQCPSVK